MKFIIHKCTKIASQNHTPIRLQLVIVYSSVWSASHLLYLLGCFCIFEGIRRRCEMKRRMPYYILIYCVSTMNRLVYESFFKTIYLRWGFPRRFQISGNYILEYIGWKLWDYCCLFSLFMMVMMMMMMTIDAVLKTFRLFIWDVHHQRYHLVSFSNNTHSPGKLAIEFIKFYCLFLHYKFWFFHDSRQ